MEPLIEQVVRDMHVMGIWVAYGGFCLLAYLSERKRHKNSLDAWGRTLAAWKETIEENRKLTTLPEDQ